MCSSFWAEYRNPLLTFYVQCDEKCPARHHLFGCRHGIIYPLITTNTMVDFAGSISPSMRRPVDVKTDLRFLLSLSLFPFS
jgi:hypothetical protein